MMIALDGDVLGLVREAIASGEYDSETDVVADALRGWLAERAGRAERARRLWREGIESGPGRFATMAEIKAEARRAFDSQVNR